MEKKKAPYAIPTIIFGILSLVGGGVIFAIIGLVLVNRGFDEISGKENEYENIGLLETGKICCKICIWITIIAILIFLISMIFV